MSDPYRPLKNAFGRFATGVGVASCRSGNGQIVALTINSFTSVSLDPPLVLWCLENQASTYPAFMGADNYAVSILRAGQEEISNRFTRNDPRNFEVVDYETLETGAPLLKDRLAGFDCKITARHKAGDHVVLIGEVLRFDSRDGVPLIYYSSAYHGRGEDE